LGAAVRAITSALQAGDHDVELAVALNLPFEAVEKIALEFRDLSATQARHVNVVPLWTSFVKVLLSLHMHQVQLIHQTMAFQ
jgi:hypothetical protein